MGNRTGKTVLALLLLLAPGFGQGGAPSGAAAEDNDKIIHFLGSAVSWYHQRAAQQKLATGPADLTYLEESARLADQTVVEAFNFARRVADLETRQHELEARQHEAGKSAQPQGDAGQYQRLIESLDKVEKQIQDTQSEIDTSRDKLARAAPAKRRAIQAQIDELGSEIGLLNARKDAIGAMAQFVVSSRDGKRVGLRPQIEELARSVPAAVSASAGNNQSSTSAASASQPAPLPSKAQPTGIWGLAADLIRVSGKVSSIDDQLSATENLRKSAADLRSPLVSEMQSLLRQGDQLFAAADSSDATALAQQTHEIDALTSNFKQATTTLLPLSKVGVLLGIYETTLENWRESVGQERRDELWQFLLRLGVLALGLALVFGTAEVWRRAIFRYVRDLRRRYQLLLVRRIVVWIAVAAIVVVFTFASQLSSAVTFAGLITAGLAVALQNVITSIVGYFFLIGKYGLRAGDRVQIAGVTGEVVDIGLVRIHLMELGGPGDAQPSGRIVAFSNSVVFQAGPGIFKQIPGTNFIWHELKLALSAETDYHEAKERITEAIDRAFGSYREILAAQSRLMERNLTTITAAELQPKVRLHYTASGIEAVVRYPVEIGRAAEMDENIMRDLISALKREPSMKLISAELAAAKAGG